jgi:hypothetical protein
MDVRGAHRRHIVAEPWRDRGCLNAVAFTTTFAAARGITPAIRELDLLPAAIKRHV